LCAPLDPARFGPTLRIIGQEHRQVCAARLCNRQPKAGLHTAKERQRQTRSATAASLKQAPISVQA
jgi:hypothetical protein